jgi:hypothetical protein
MRYGDECSAMPTKRLIKVGTGRKDKWDFFTGFSGDM